MFLLWQNRYSGVASAAREGVYPVRCCVGALAIVMPRCIGLHMIQEVIAAGARQRQKQQQQHSSSAPSPGRPSRSLALIQDTEDESPKSSLPGKEEVSSRLLYQCGQRNMIPLLYAAMEGR